MGRGNKARCDSGGECNLVSFSVKRKVKIKKTKQIQIVVTSGVRCKWCKRADGRLKRVVMSNG